MPLVSSFLFLLASQGEIANLPETVTCEVSYSLRRHGAIRARARCPDVPGREWLERTSRDHVNLAPIRRPDEFNNDQTGQITYRRFDADGETFWEMQPGAISIREPFYPRPPEANDWMASCTARFDVIDGEPHNICMSCNADDLPGWFRQEFQRGIQRSLYVRTGEPFEIVYRYAFTLDDRPARSFPDVPTCREE